MLNPLLLNQIKPPNHRFQMYKIIIIAFYFLKETIQGMKLI